MHIKQHGNTALLWCVQLDLLEMPIPSQQRQHSCVQTRNPCILKCNSQQFTVIVSMNKLPSKCTAGDRRNFLVTGTSGTGESVWAIHLLASFAQQGKTVLCVAPEGAILFNGCVPNWLLHPLLSCSNTSLLHGFPVTSFGYRAVISAIRCADNGNGPQAM